MQLAVDPAIGVVALTEAHVDRTATMLAHAFEVDAAYRYLFPDAATRTSGLQDFFARNLRMHLPHACTFVAIDASGCPVASVTLRPPHGVHISLWTMLRRGLLPFAVAHGHVAVHRLLWLKRTYGTRAADAAVWSMRPPSTR
jgi:hypothetical protein